MLKKDIKKTSFLGNCCDNLIYQSVWRINKVQFHRTLHYSEFSTQGKTGFYKLQKHKNICLYMIFNPDFENSMQYLVI